MPDLHQLSRRLRRMYLRRRRLLAALLSACAAVAVVHTLAPPAPRTMPMLVAARDLRGGAVIGPDDIRQVQAAPELIPAGSQRSLSAALGRVVAAPMRRGEAVTDRRLVGSAWIAGYGDNLVAAPVRLQDDDVVSLLEVGDRIDVYAADGDPTVPARQILSSAQVVLLPDSGDGSGREGALVVLATTPDAAARLAQAGATEQLSVSLRG